MTIITQALAPETLEVALTSESQEFLDQLLENTQVTNHLSIDLPSTIVMELPSAVLDEPEEDDEKPDEDDKPSPSL